MFSFFSKKDKPDTTDKVYLSKVGKYKGILEQLQAGNGIILVCYFKVTRTEIQQVLDAAGIRYSELPASSYEPGLVYVTSADHLNQYSQPYPGASYFFLEHFPSYNRESELLRHMIQVMQVKLVTFYTSVDEPFFQLFGGERLSGLMQKLGLTEEEAIEHNMVTQSIVRAQQKIDEKRRSEIPADSAREWMRLNTDANL